MQRLYSTALRSSFSNISKAWKQPATCSSRSLHTTSVTYNHESVSPGEKRIEDILKSKLNVEEIMVRDISGGCGSMYEIFVASKDFINKKTVQQHRIVNEILKDEVKQMHGLRILTKVPE
ncbi:bolA-like protein 3 [Rhopilema esculentum]|uniref:bolA-like protein 3 n=1 Tax=Rhopilema esculentum TaxID=499914 RepID=UPI0031D523E9